MHEVALSDMRYVVCGSVTTSDSVQSPCVDVDTLLPLDAGAGIRMARCRTSFLCARVTATVRRAFLAGFSPKSSTRDPSND